MQPLQYHADEFTNLELVNDFYLNKLSTQDLTIEDLQTLILANDPLLRRRQHHLNRYLKKQLKVQRRHSTTLQQATNRIVNHFRKLIVDQKTDYLTGTAITYNYEADIEINEELQRLLKVNHYDYLDAEAVRMAGATGVSYRLAYVDSEGILRFKTLPSQNVITLEDEHDVKLAVHRTLKLNEAGQQAVKLEVYDEKMLRIYEGDVNGFHLIEETPHFFNHCPVIAFHNIDDMTDFECVDELIDAYDELISMSMDEITEFRMAYLAILSEVELEEDTLQQAKTHGAIYLNDSNSKIEYITKNLNDVFYENAKATIEKNIYKFSATLDMSEESFTGASGEARKWKLLAIENKAQAAERLFSKAICHQFQLMSDYFAIKQGKYMDPLGVQLIFNRNLPSEIGQIVEENSKLVGQVSQRTLLSRLPFISDVEKELEDEQGDAYLKAFQAIQPTSSEEVEGEDYE